MDPNMQPQTQPPNPGQPQTPGVGDSGGVASARPAGPQPPVSPPQVSQPQYPQPGMQPPQYSQQPYPGTAQQQPVPQQAPAMSSQWQPAQTAATPPSKESPAIIRMFDWLMHHWYVPIVAGILVVMIGNIIWQVTRPINMLPAGLVVDKVLKVGGMDRDKVVAQMNKLYGEEKVKLFFGDATVPHKTPKAKELGIQVENTTRLAGVSYPFALRLVPTSYWWAKDLVKVGNPVYNYDKTTLDTYALKNLGEDCIIPPKNASLKLDDGRFAVVPAESGGKCSLTEFKDDVLKTTFADGFAVKTKIKKVEAPLTNEIAKQLGDELNNNIDKDLPLQAAGETRQIKSTVVKGWLSFKPFIPEDKNDGKPLPPPRLLYVIEPERVQRYLTTSGVAEKVEKKPGVTKIATTDFTETSRTDGSPGVLINIEKTIASIDPYINGREGTATVVVEQVPATMQFTRTYTPSEAGYRALIQQFADDNPGKFSIVLRELGGKKPYLSAAVNENTPMPAAGIEGIYLAYAAQKGIEDGSIQPTDRIYSGLSVTECMQAAVRDQDKDCIDALLAKISNPVAQRRMQEIGLTATKFDGQVIVTSADDMATFMQKLSKSELELKSKSNVEMPLNDLTLRDGMKSALISGKVAGGALDKNYNEVAFGTKNGQFILSMMSEGADGSKTAAKLVKAVEALRQQKQDLKK